MKIKSKYVSVKRTPWDNLEELSPLELFIKNNFKETYYFRHPKFYESELLNSIIITRCKFSNSTSIKKFGFTKNRIQRFYCNRCNKSFNVLTNTIFDNHKISISEWIEFLLYVFRYESIHAIARSNKNSPTTTKYWLKKLFLVLEHYQDDIILENNVYLDETFFKVIHNDIKYKEDDKEYRVLSMNQICIGVATSDNKIYAKI